MMLREERYGRHILLSFVDHEKLVAESKFKLVSEAYHCLLSGALISFVKTFLTRFAWRFVMSSHPTHDHQDEHQSRKNGPNTITQLWQKSGGCPVGTIPVRRTKEEDVLRASSIKNYGKKKLASVPKPKSVDPDLISESGH